MDDRSYHLVEPFVLFWLAQGYMSISHERGHGKTPKDLAVEVFYKLAGEFLLAGEQCFPCGIGDKKGKAKACQYDDDQRKPGKCPGIAGKRTLCFWGIKGSILG